MELAIAMGDRYDQSVISAVENNRSSLRFDGLMNAAKELGVSIDYLFGLTDDPTPSVALAEKINNPEFRNLAVRDASGAMGPEAYVEDDPIIGYLAFRAVWLKKHGIDPDNASMIEATGDSMLPTIKNGSMVLVDHQRTRRVNDRVFAVRTEDGVVIKRTTRNGNGWQLASDNPDYEPLPFPKDGRVIGEVRWAGRSLRAEG